MKNITSVLVISMLASIGFLTTSCTEDPAGLITEKTWVLASVNMAGMDMSPAEILATEGSEYQMTLKTDGTIIFADQNGQNPMSGVWQFQQNKTQFVVSGFEAGKSDVNTINVISATDLWFWHMDGADKMIMHYKVK